jgi:hypothetical protein
VLYKYPIGKGGDKKMKKKVSYKVFGFITTILVLSVLGIALLGNVGQGQETQSSDPVFIIVGWTVKGDFGFDHEIVTVDSGTKIVVLNGVQPVSGTNSVIVSVNGLTGDKQLSSGRSTEFTPTHPGIIYITSIGYYKTEPLDSYEDWMNLVRPEPVKIFVK